MMSDITPRTRRYLTHLGLALGILVMIADCKKKEDMGGTFLGPSVLNGIIYQFYATVDNSLTASCGSATVPQSSSSSSGSGSGSGSGSTTTTSTTYNIASNYYFKDTVLAQGQQMVLRYVYSTTRQSYSLSIANTATLTCQTVNGILCDSAGTTTCPTTDSVNCGGASTFIFSVRNPAMNFTASVGTISWADGFALTSDNSGVNNAVLDLNMSAADGTIFVGKVTCISDPS